MNLNEVEYRDYNQRYNQNSSQSLTQTFTQISFKSLSNRFKEVFKLASKSLSLNRSKSAAEFPETKVFRSFRVDMIESFSLDLSSVSSPRAMFILLSLISISNRLRYTLTSHFSDSKRSLVYLLFHHIVNRYQKVLEDESLPFHRHLYRYDYLL